MKFRKAFFLFFALVNFVSQILIYLLHQDRLNTAGIEGVKALQFWFLIPAGILLIIPFVNFKLRTETVRFLALLSLALVVYIAAVHTGVRQAMSLFDHPQYLISMISSALLFAVSE